MLYYCFQKIKKGRCVTGLYWYNFSTKLCEKRALGSKIVMGSPDTLSVLFECYLALWNPNYSYDFQTSGPN
jgi:hypothetical protein